MKLLRLAWASVWNRRAMAILVVLTIALSSALLIGVDLLRTEAKRSFERTVSGTDLIVGARTGAIPLLLYTVFHIGEPSNNVRYSTYQSIAKHPNVAWTIPISLGDSHAGFRVVGTNADFFRHYRYGAKRSLSFGSGKAFAGLFDVVLGAEVAQKLNYRLGQSLVVAHGTGKVSFAKHENLPFVVSGILAPTGTPIDRSLYVSMQAISAIHIGWESGIGVGRGPSVETVQSADLEPQSITAFMLGLKNRVATFALQRQINQFAEEPLMAILPVATLQQLWQLLGVAEKALLLISAAVVLAGLLAVLIAIWSSVEQRRREMAILRATGARAWHVFGLLLLEAAVMTLAGLLLGLALLWLALQISAPALASYGLYLDEAKLSLRALWMLSGIFAMSLLLSALPAFLAYRKALSDALVIRV
jgi:putative ABC transport system permease protein